MAVIDHKTVNNTENYNSYIVTRVMVLISNGISSCKGKSWTLWKWFKGGIKNLSDRDDRKSNKMLPVTHYDLLHMTRYVWPTTCSLLHVYYSWLVTCVPLPFTHYLWPITVTHDLLLRHVTCDTLPVTHCLWPIASNPLPTTLYLEINGPIPVTHDQSTITLTHESLPLTCYQKPISWDLLPVSLYAWPITCDPLSVTR